MSIPTDPMERKLWLLEFWRESYGRRFDVFLPDDQPFPEPQAQCTDMYEPSPPEPDERGEYDPSAVRHVRWFNPTREFLMGRYDVPTLNLYFDCLVTKYRGYSDQTRRDERAWRFALRMGTFIFEGKLGVGFSCRSQRCPRGACVLS